VCNTYSTSTAYVLVT